MSQETTASDIYVLYFIFLNKKTGTKICSGFSVYFVSS